jgi:hypothetical protein
LVAVLFWAATATAPEPRVYPAAQDLLNQTPDATVLAPPVSEVTSLFVEEILRLHHEVGGEMQD